MKKSIIPGLLIFLLIFGITGCGNDTSTDNNVMSAPGFRFRPDIEILDAYCTYSPYAAEPMFEFRFILENLKNEDIEVSYYWSLNEPALDFSSSQEGINDPQARLFEGKESISLAAAEAKPVVIFLKQEMEYDPRFYVMYISVYHNDEQVGFYREQKSTYDWDYTNLPPVKRTEKPSYKHIWIDTFVEKTPSGYRVNIDNIIFLPPERTARLDINNIMISGGPLLADMLTDSSDPDDEGFHDADNNGELSIGDYLSMDGGTGGDSLSFESRDEPSIRINEIGYEPEKIEEENRDAIRIQNIAYKVIDEMTIELEVKVSSDKPLVHVDAQFYHPGEGGVSSGSDHLELAVTEGDTLVYRKVIEAILGDKGDLYLFVFITDGTNELIQVVGKLN